MEERHTNSLTVLLAVLVGCVLVGLALTILPSYRHPVARVTPVPITVSNGESSAASTTPAQPGPRTAIAPTQPTPRTATVETGSSADRVNLRNSPSQNASILGTAGHGERLVLLEGPVRGDDLWWWKVEHNGVTGWIAGDFVRPDLS